MRTRRSLSALLAALLAASGLAVIAPAANAQIPTKPANTTQIVVKTGGERDAGTGVIQPLEGVQLRIRTGATLLDTCVSDADGDCVFQIPDSSLSSNANNNDLVVDELAPAAGSPAAEDYFRNGQFITSTNGTTFSTTNYTLAIDNVARGSSFTVGAGGSNATTRSGIWQDSHANPPELQQCGLDIALVSDLSYSVALSNSLGALKTAAKGFVNTLAGTPSKISLYTFGTTAPAPGTSTLLDRSTLDAGHVDQMLDTIDDYEIDDGSYTNWDAALRQLFGEGYDQVVMITDGNPTRSGVPASGSSASTRFVELEHAIFSANTLKAEGTRVVAVGVGSSFGTGQNLRAISGPTSGSDYFTTGWSDLAESLKELALGYCEGTVTVVKEVVPWNWDGQSSGTPTGGWTFDATVDEGSVSPAQATTSDENGAVNFGLEVPQEGAELTVVEDVKDGYTFAGASCTVQGGGSLPVDAVADGFRVDVGPKDIVTCVVRNRAPQPQGAIVVDKLWVVDGGEPTDVFPQGFTATPTVDGAQVAWGASTAKSAGTVQVGETGVVVPSDYCEVTAQQVTAVNGSAVTPASVAGGATYGATVAPGATTTVTITNTVECVGILHLLKVVESGDAAPTAWTLSATPDGGGTAISGASGIFGEVAPGVEYDLAESGGPAGYTQVGVGCSTNPDGPFEPMTSVTVEARTTMYCQFVNAAIAPQLRLVKEVAGVDVDADNWTLSATADGQPTVSGNGVVDYVEVGAGVEYALAETAVDGFDDSEFDASDWTCTVTSGPGAGTETTGDEIELSYGQKVECVITNTVRGATPTFDKAAGTATSNGDGTWDISYRLTATNPSKLLDVEYDLVDDPDLPAGVIPVSALVEQGATTVIDLDAWDGSDLEIAEDAELAADSSVVYDVTITVRIPSSVPAGTLVCDAEGNGFDNSATLTPTGGTPLTDDACVSVQPPTVEHDKVVTSVEQQQDGTWEIRYLVTVTATGSGAALYDLDDVPTFGGDIQIESAAATADPAGQAYVDTWDGDAQPVLADERVIAGGSQHEYEIVIVASVDVDATAADTDCTLVDGEDGTGFLNTATLVAGGTETVADDCASPAAPELDKQAISVTQNPDASWTVVYRVDVVNPSTEASLVYDLEDAPGFPSGVTIEGVTVTKDGAPHAWADRSQPVATGQVLEPSDAGDPTKGIDSYVFAFTITVDAGVSGEVLECSEEGAGYGLFNEATVTSGQLDPITDDDCLPLEEAVVPTVTKTVAPGYPHQLANGDWAIRYTVTVSTPAEAEQATRYDLDDTLVYGDGITVVTRSASGPDGAIAGWTGAMPDTQLAADVLLPAGASHVYTIDVTASVASGVIDTTAADCEVTEGEDGTGFLNTALLTVGSITRDAEACASPASPLLDKELVGTPVKDDVTGDVTVTYEITVTNPSDLELTYDLDDSLGFAFGVLIVDATVETAEPGITPSADWTGIAPDVSIVTGVSIAPHDEHVYTVTVVAKPSLLVEEPDQECVPATPGKGYFNEAMLTSGNEVLVDEACAPIPDTDLPTLPLPPDDPGLAETGLAATGPVLAGMSLLGAGIVLILMMLARRRRET